MFTSISREIDILFGVACCVAISPPVASGLRLLFHIKYRLKDQIVIVDEAHSQIAPPKRKFDSAHNMLNRFDGLFLAAAFGRPVNRRSTGILRVIKYLSIPVSKSSQCSTLATSQEVRHLFEGAWPVHGSVWSR